MVFSTTGLEFKDMAQNPLVRREPVSASCNRRPDEGLETHVLKFQPRRAKYHAKRDRRCRSTNSGRLMTLLDLSPADFRRFLTVTVTYGGGSVMVWGCISHDCSLDLVTIQGKLTGDQYIREVLQPVVVPHFDNHPLATRPVYMDDNVRPHRSEQ
jgi:hypothetical protein